VVQLADEPLYTVKDSDRNGVRVFERIRGALDLQVQDARTHRMQ
jgi:hypothetical protein